MAAADRASWIRDDDDGLTNLLSRSQFPAPWLFSLLLGAFVISTQPLRALCINLSLQLRDSRSIPSKNCYKEFSTYTLPEAPLWPRQIPQKQSPSQD